MTEINKESHDSKNDLLHLSAVSFLPKDVVSIQWDKTQELSKTIVTQIHTRFDIFVLEADSFHYKNDVELLKKATGKLV